KTWRYSLRSTCRNPIEVGGAYCCLAAGGLLVPGHCHRCLAKSYYLLRLLRRLRLTYLRLLVLYPESDCALVDIHRCPFCRRELISPHLSAKRWRSHTQ